MRLLRHCLLVGAGLGGAAALVIILLYSTTRGETQEAVFFLSVFAGWPLSVPLSVVFDDYGLPNLAFIIVAPITNGALLGAIVGGFLAITTRRRAA